MLEPRRWRGVSENTNTNTKYTCDTGQTRNTDCGHYWHQLEGISETLTGALAANKCEMLVTVRHRAGRQQELPLLIAAAAPHIAYRRHSLRQHVHWLAVEQNELMTDGSRRSQLLQ